MMVSFQVKGKPSLRLRPAKRRGVLSEHCPMRPRESERRSALPDPRRPLLTLERTTDTDLHAVNGS